MRARLPIALTLGLALTSVTVAGCVGGVDVLGPDPNCKDVDVRAVLHVDAGDPRRLWGTDLGTARDLTVRPRPSLGWRLDPARPAQLVDPAGELVAIDGDTLLRACFDAWTNTYFIGPESLSVKDPSPS